MQTSDQTVYLFKKSLGIANTNVNVAAGLEVYTSPLSANAGNIYTQTIPDADLSSALTTDNSWSLGTSTRKYATAYPYIAYYENVQLASMSENPGIAFQVSGNVSLLKGALPAYKLLNGTPVYTLTVKNSAGTQVNAAKYVVDADSGIVTFYNETSVTNSLLPTISFWRYEGARLTNQLLTSSITTSSLNVSTIGIGTSAPTAMLDVAGMIKAPSSILQTLYTSTVGVGTSSPQFLMDLCGVGTSSIFRVAASGTAVSSLMVIEAGIDGSNTSGNVCQQTFRQRGGGGGIIKYDISLLYNSTNAYGLDFVGNARSLFLATDGKVGVGINNPSYVLDVNGATRVSTLIVSNRGQFDNTMGNLVIENSLGQGCTRLTAFGTDQSISYIQAASSFYFTQWYSPTPVMMIGTAGTNYGRVGIGTESPSYTLDVTGRVGITSTIHNSAGGDFITRRFSPNDKYGIGQYSDGAMRMFGSAAYGSASTRLSFASNDTISDTSTGFIDVLTATRAGNVGIGTNSPAYKLDVVGSGRFQSNFNLQNLNTNNVLLQSGNQQVLISNASAPYMYLQTVTTGTSRITMGSYSNVTPMPLTINEYGGNVGIGTNSPSAQLHVNGNAKISSFLVLGGATYRGDYASPTAGRIIFGDSTGWYYRFATYSNSVLTDIVSIKDNGFVGIGTTTPNFPLEIITSSFGPGINGRQLSDNGPDYYVGSGESIGLKATAAIWTTNKFIASSDQRIKKNIVEINDNEALEDLRKIEPKKYKYIETFQRGSDEVYGFLAQQVSSIVTNAVGKQTSFIPDIYSSYTVSVTSNVSSQYVAFKTSPAILSSLKLSQRLKFYDANQEFNATISSIQATNVFLEVSDSNLPPVSTFSSMVFLYGTEVNDFLTLNKDALFTLAFAATQQIDRIQQSSLQTVASLSAQLSTALGRLDAQESTIAALLAR